MTNNEHTNRPDYMYQQKEDSYGKWMLTLLLQAIPVVNIVMLIIWACGQDSRKNYARATLTYMGIAFILSFVLSVTVLQTIGM